MGKNVTPFAGRQRPSEIPKATRTDSRILLRVGRQRYALDINCSATPRPPEPDSTAGRNSRRGEVVETKFLRLRNPPKLGDRVDGWRVCWLGGWDRGRVFFVVMVERSGNT